MDEFEDTQRLEEDDDVGSAPAYGIKNLCEVTGHRIVQACGITAHEVRFKHDAMMNLLYAAGGPILSVKSQGTLRETDPFGTVYTRVFDEALVNDPHYQVGQWSPRLPVQDREWGIATESGKPAAVHHDAHATHITCLEPFSFMQAPDLDSVGVVDVPSIQKHVIVCGPVFTTHQLQFEGGGWLQLVHNRADRYLRLEGARMVLMLDHHAQCFVYPSLALKPNKPP